MENETQQFFQLKMSSDPKNAVHRYLRDQNRPYSTNDILLNLHKEHGKTAIQKAIDTLVVEGKVIEKVESSFQHISIQISTSRNPSIVLSSERRGPTPEKSLQFCSYHDSRGPQKIFFFKW